MALPSKSPATKSQKRSTKENSSQPAELKTPSSSERTLPKSANEATPIKSKDLPDAIEKGATAELATPATPRERQLKPKSSTNKPLVGAKTTCVEANELCGVEAEVAIEKPATAIAIKGDLIEVDGKRYRLSTDIKADYGRCEIAEMDGGMVLMLHYEWYECKCKRVQLEAEVLQCAKNSKLSHIFRLIGQGRDDTKNIHYYVTDAVNIKPSVFVASSVAARNKVFLVHFGLARRYRAYDRALVPQRSAVPCFGSLRYMPRRSHKQLERSRKDDLESWLYMACEFFQPNVLPWANESSYEKVYRMKGVFMSEVGFKHILDVCAGLPRPTATIARLINVLQYDTTPDYRFFKAIFKNAIIQGNYKGDKLDWVKETANEQQLQREKREEFVTELNADTAHGGHFKMIANNDVCCIDDIIDRNFTSNDNTHSNSREPTQSACNSRSSTSSKSDKRSGEKIAKKRKDEGRRRRSTEPKLNAKLADSKSLMLQTAKILKKENRSQARAEKQKEKVEKRRDATARGERDTGKEFTARPNKRIRSTRKAKQSETKDVAALGTELKSTLKPPK
ncbi:Tau-tubulin kinase 2 [Toxocara canis]|uniref:Tau-tubulin kinase 2 n=1 Tax=Toxocara canis TaxID=6265 RepID=A0A0B2VNA9_TOXCA|nr:Tau-tubulin kinase 2 [Toxocara canis]